MSDFNKWWHEVGSGMPPLKGEDYSEHVARVVAAACESLTASLQHARGEVEEAKGLLSVARCPNCDGGGTTRYGDQCEWCYKRDELLNPPPSTPGEQEGATHAE